MPWIQRDQFPAAVKRGGPCSHLHPDHARQDFPRTTLDRTVCFRVINRANPLRILLVDDEPYMRVFVGRVLSTAVNCVLTEARDGQEGIEKSRSADPELIILDINMPRVDGVQALGEIRAMKPDTPIVMLTSIAEEVVVEKCVSKGASYFIRKDVGANVLKSELGEMLRQFFPNPQPSDERPTTP